MLRSLLWKELRTCWPFAAAALALQSVFSFLLVRQASRNYLHELDRDDTVMPVLFLSFGLGIALGLWQSLGEGFLGTDALLAHAARRRSRVVAAKLLAGTLLQAAAFWLPLGAGLAAFLARTQAPLLWSDARYLWIVAGGGWIAYLGVLAAGLRGMPWREGGRQLLGLAALFVLVAVAVDGRRFDVAVGALAAGAAFAVAWAFSGFAAREF